MTPHSLLPLAAFVTLAATSFLWTWDERAGGIALAFFVFPFTAGLATLARSPLESWLPRALLVTLVGLGALFAADLIPTAAHVQDPWIMGYDLFPMDTLAVKKRVIREAIDREHLVFFEHDPLIAAGYIRETDGRRHVEQVL